MTLETSTLQKHKEEKVYIKRRKRTSWLKRRNANKHTVGLKYGTNFEALYPGRIARYLPLTVRQFIKKRVSFYKSCKEGYYRAVRLLIQRPI